MASYTISLPADITLTPAIGFTPWKGYYHNKAAFTDISLKANKDIKVTDQFSFTCICTSDCGSSL